MKKPLLLIFFILLADQVLKIWIKMNFTLGQEYNLLGDWCRLHFIENEGMALAWLLEVMWAKYCLLCLE